MNETAILHAFIGWLKEKKGITLCEEETHRGTLNCNYYPMYENLTNLINQFFHERTLKECKESISEN